MELKITALPILCLIYISCQHETKSIPSKYRYIEPHYDLFTLKATTDSISFGLDDSTYNIIKSFNTFSQGGIEYISFYDQRSQSVTIYHFQSRRMVKKILLKDCFRNYRLFKTSVYCKNFDSIFVSNMTQLHLLNREGVIKKTIDFLENPRYAWAIFANTSPPIFKDKLLYACVRPSINETSFNALKKWKVLYKFNIQKEEAALNYNLPELLQKDIYGDRFLKYSYCYNNRGNFVFSFWADTTIYETNLVTYNIAYYGKSKFQNNIIKSVSKDDLLGDGDYKNYLTKDSYGAIYFDQSAKRYLRVAKSKISESDYEARKRQKKQRIIIFDEHFKIIGESQLSDEISLDDLFFTNDGNMYARTMKKDEYALHFIRLGYIENKNDQTQFTENEKK